MNRLHGSLRRVAMYFGASFLLCIGVVGVSVFFVFDAHAKYQQFRVQLQREQAGVFSRLADQEYVHRTHGLVTALENKGLIGRIDRLEWVAALTELGQQVLVDGYQFEMSPAEISEIGAVQLAGVDISITGQFLHDGEVVKFFGMLSEFAPAVFRIVSVEIEKERNKVGAVNPGQSESENNEPVVLYPMKMTVLISWSSVFVSPAQVNHPKVNLAQVDGQQL